MVREASSGVPQERLRGRHPRQARSARLTLAVVGGAALVLFVGCASVPKLPGERRDDQLAALQARVLELSQNAAVQESELARLRQQVASLEARLGGAAAPRSGGQTGGTSGASMSAPSAMADRDVAANPPPPRASAPPARPAGRLEESELPMEEPVAPPTAAPVPPPPLRPAPPGPAPRPAAPAPPVAPAAAVAPAAGEGGPVTHEAQVVYDEAYTLYHQGKYPQAEARFEEFLAESPHSELSDNAQYWIGAARFDRGDYNGALAAFRRTVERYPDANKVPDALYKIGQTLEELHEVGQALAVYDELVKRFPETAAATLASERQAKLPH